MSKKLKQPWDNISPYDFIDYKWGGFGPTLWFTFPSITGKNVYEKATKLDKVEREGDYDVSYCTDYWLRVWDDTLQCWRELTPDELIILPKFQPRKESLLWNTERFQKFVVPEIKKVMPNIAAQDIVSVQPMSMASDVIFHLNMMMTNNS